MSETGRLSPEALEALSRRFEAQSRKAQAYYMIMHRVRDMAGSDDAASEWMEKGLPAFGGKSPAMLIAEGRNEEVLAYLASLKPETGG